MTSKYPNSGSLFRNEKRTSDKHAHYTGQAEVNGEEYWVDAYIVSPPEKKTFMSLRFKPKAAQAEAPQQQKSLAAELDDDIPF